MLQAWLNENPVGIEDGLRHDKWCAMMWPRLRLLHELLAETGSFWMTLDDNEIHLARSMLEDIFEEQNFVACCIWQKNYAPKNTAKYFSEDHDYLLVFAKNKNLWRPQMLERTAEMEARYENSDNDPRGPWKPSDLTARNPYSKGKYTVTGPTGKTFDSGTRYWRQSYENFLKLDQENRIWWGDKRSNMPQQKRFLSEVQQGRVPQTLWLYNDVGHTQDAKKELLQMNLFEARDGAVESDSTITPKPSSLIERILEIATNTNALVLDSFAGSGTTAHAVLTENRKDGGNRKFILVECENYADRLTAERVRRVINGYTYTGTQRETLLQQNITFSDLKKADKLLHQIAGIENLEAYRFDKIEKKIKDGVLTVEGVQDIKEKMEGLGGAFTYCTLGESIDMDRLLSGESLPSFAQLGALLFHMATNEALDPAKITEPDVHGLGYLGESSAFHVWLIYRSDLEFLCSREAALTLARARDLACAKTDKRHLVFAPAKFVSQKLLEAECIPVEFAPLPWALYRVERS